MAPLDRLLAALAHEGPAAPRPSSPGDAGHGTDATDAAAASAPERADEARLRAVRDELARLEPWGSVTPAALAELRQHFDRRLAAVAAAPAGGGQPAQPPVGTLAGGAAAAAVTAARPSLQEFLADRSILIVSYAGAFLLVVATLLFELYAVEGFSGWVRFGGVLALDLVFGAAGWYCLRRPRLRLVGTTYVAIFALMAPLVLAAAYVFLVLREYGLSRDVAVALAGGACAALYGALGVRLRSEGYAVLSLLALGVGWIAAIQALDAGTWGAPLLVALALAYGAIWNAAGRAGDAGEVFVHRSVQSMHAAAALAAGWAVFGGSGGDLGTPEAAQPLAVTLGLVAALYTLYAWIPRRWERLSAAAAVAVLAVLAATAALGLGETAAAIALTAMAWLCAGAARRVPAPGGRAQALFLVVHPLRLLAAVLAVVPAFLTVRPDWAQAAVLFVAGGVGVALALDCRAPAWLLLALGLWSADWYWVVRSIVPAPPDATAGTLLTAYSPLPALQAVAGLVVGRLAGQSAAWRARPAVAAGAIREHSWDWPVLLAAGVNAAWVLAGAAVREDWLLLGRLLLAYAALAYGVGWLSGLTVVAGAAPVAALASAWSLLAAAHAPAEWYVAALTVGAAAIYAAGIALARAAARRPGSAGAAGALSRYHRQVALGATGLTALACPGVTRFTHPGAGGALVALGSLWTLAALVYMESRRRDQVWWAYAAGLLAALGSDWIASYAGAANPQWYVALPGLWLIGTGNLIRRRRPAPPPDHRRAAQWTSGAGAALLLGTTALQAIASDQAAAYTAALVLEGVGALAGGILLRDRIVVLGGAAAIALGALRALLLVVEHVPLFAVFGAVAIVLLAAGAALAAGRDRLAGARAAVAGWTDWD